MSNYRNRNHLSIFSSTFALIPFTRLTHSTGFSAFSRLSTPSSFSTIRFTTASSTSHPLHSKQQLGYRTKHVDLSMKSTNQFPPLSGSVPITLDTCSGKSFLSLVKNNTVQYLGLPPVFHNSIFFPQFYYFFR